jgi:hypothetical protein
MPSNLPKTSRENAEKCHKISAFAHKTADKKPNNACYFPQKCLTFLAYAYDAKSNAGIFRMALTEGAPRGPRTGPVAGLGRRRRRLRRLSRRGFQLANAG